MSSKLAYMLCRFATVRKVVRFMERNHLTWRTSDDIFYHTRPVFKCMEPDSALSCFAYTRTPKRPKNFFRKWFFDLARYDEPEIIAINSNMAVRNAFRNIDANEIHRSMLRARVAPANQHGRIAASRNSASNFLSHKDWGDRQFQFSKFSLSGSRAEQEACGFGYRGVHQATDCAQELRNDKVLEPPPELCGMVHHNHWVVISTDTTNHLPQADKNAILGNGVPIVSYSPTVVSEAQRMGDRTTFWDGHTLVTRINGGGDYRDDIANTNLDVEYVDCPDGALMLVYVDVFGDPNDRTHSYICETPYAKIARGTRLYDDFKLNARANPISPYTITNAKLQTFSCLGVRHNDLIQIVDNVARKTHYFTRAELLALDGVEPGMKPKFRLQKKSPLAFNEPQDDQLRYECLVRLGFDNLYKICKHCPEFNLAEPPRQSRKSYVATAVIHAARNRDDFRQIIAQYPDYRQHILHILAVLGIDYELPPDPPALPEVPLEVPGVQVDQPPFGAADIPPPPGFVV